MTLFLMVVAATFLEQLCVSDE